MKHVPHYTRHSQKSLKNEHQTYQVTRKYILFFLL